MELTLFLVKYINTTDEEKVIGVASPFESAIRIAEFWLEKKMFLATSGWESKNSEWVKYVSRTDSFRMIHEYGRLSISQIEVVSTDKAEKIFVEKDS